MRCYLNCKYEEKEEIKALGAKWDSKNKKWFCSSDEISKFTKWLPKIDFTGLKPLTILCSENGLNKEGVRTFLINNNYIKDIYNVLPEGEKIGIIQNGPYLYYNKDAIKFIVDNIPEDAIDESGTHEVLELIRSKKTKDEIVAEIGIDKTSLNNILAKLYKSKMIDIDDTLSKEEYQKLKENLKQILSSGFEMFEIEAMVKVIKDEIKEETKRNKIEKRNEEILNLIDLGFSIKDIAEQLELSTNTIERNVQELIRTNKTDIKNFLSEETEEKILNAIKEIPDWDYRLMPIKEKLPEEISYFEIKLVIYKNKLRK